MTTIDIQEASTDLSSLVTRAAQGETFIITKAGKPLVKVSALDAPTVSRRLGFLAGEIEVPEDFDTLGEEKIATLFGTQSRDSGPDGGAGTV
jgi:prevent-host-death family protein